MGSERGLTVVMMVVLGAVSVRAVGAEGDVEARAIACFQAGKALYREEQFTAAAAKFREAYELKPSWKLFYNIAQSEASAKRHGLALEAFERFLSEGGDDIVETRRDQVLAEVERLRQIVGFLKVQAPEGTVLLVDDVVRGTAPVLMALPVAVGTKHELKGERDGEVLQRQQFRVTGGQTVVITIADADVASTAPGAPMPVGDAAAVEEDGVDRAETPAAEAPTEEKRRSPLVLPGFVLLGTGAATGIAGAVVGGIALARNRNISLKCGDTFCPEYADDEKSINNLGTASTALIAAGSTVAVAGFVLLFVGKRREKKEASMVSVTPVLNPDVANLSFEWRF